MLLPWLSLLTWLCLFLLTFALIAILIVRWFTGRDDADWNPSEVGAAVLGCTFGGLTALIYLIFRNEPDLFFFYVCLGGFVGALLGAWAWYASTGQGKT